MTNSRPRTLLIFGFGFTARFIAHAAREAGFHVLGTSRSPQDGLRDFNDAAQIKDAINKATHILSSVPPNETDDPVLGAYGDDIKAANANWIGYLSTTGVYGNTDGEWVDEDSPLNPSSPRSARRVRDEAAWAAHQAHIFRIAGIYGPSRNPLEQLKSGTARRIDKPGHKFGRIHVEDIARAVVASMQNPAPGTAYNLSDDEPAAPADVTAYAADLLGITAPPLIAYDDADMSPMAKTFWQDNRQVRNDRMKALVGGQLLYPTYREGLQALQKTQDN